MENESKKKVPWGIIIILTMFVIGYMLGGIMVWSAMKARNAVKESWEKNHLQLQQTQVDTLDEWTTLQMAMVMTESEFNPQAVGKAGDWGIFQQIPIYVAECNRILDLRKSDQKRYVHEDSFDVGKSIEMFNLLQSYYNPEQDIDVAIRYQNKAGWYAKKVKKNIVFIQQMEEVRRQLQERARTSI